MIAGAIDIRSSFGIRRQRRGAVLQSAGSTLIVVANLGGVLRDFGELFWINVLLLALLGMAASSSDA